jgi:hypothetical protein
MKHPHDITGMRFGKLVVLEISPDRNKNGRVMWLCKCDCGNIKLVAHHELLCKRLYKGRESGTRSCGCLQRTEGANKTRLEGGEACLNQLIYDYKEKATDRNLSFELSKEEFRKLTKQNCIYCGKEPSQVKRNRNTFGDYTYNGIDRIDSSEGYNVDNCVSCCGDCNRAKSNMLLEDFYSWISRIYNKMKNPN